MANNCFNRVSIYAKKEVLEWLDSKLDLSEEAIIEQFGNPEAENFIDKVGCKWISKSDNYFNDDTEYVWQFDSAWYPPSDLLKEMYRQLAGLDPEVFIQGEYEDEAYDPVGVLKIDKDGYRTSEHTPYVDQWEYEEENPDGYYWDDVIEPLLEELRDEI
jgi:hypothetical protein